VWPQQTNNHTRKLSHQREELGSKLRNHQNQICRCRNIVFVSMVLTKGLVLVTSAKYYVHHIRKSRRKPSNYLAVK
jgi:hypothetical protein